MMADLVTEETTGAAIANLLESYVQASEEGRRHIELVAQREAELNVRASRPSR